VGNGDEFAPVVADSDPRPNAVALGAPAGAGTGVVIAGSDRDGGSAVSFQLTADAGGLFTIDRATGAISVADAALLRRDGIGTYTITVLALSSDGGSESATFVITVEPDQQPVAFRLIESGLLEDAVFDELDPTFGFNGRNYQLPISPFLLPDEAGLVFKSLAQGEFADGADAPARDPLHFLQAAFRNILTQPGENAFQIAVRNGLEASLRVFRGIPDQEFLSSRDVKVQVPVDAFIHTQEDAVVYLSARMSDGSPIPTWLHFDPSTGRFEGKAPAGTPPELTILVEARDHDGRHAETVFRIRLEKLPAGRAGLSEQIRSAQRDSLDALRNLQLPAQARGQAGARP
jgi:hypothetical protein